MSDRPIKLVVLDQDPIFRLGLCSALNGCSECDVVWNGEQESDAWNKITALIRDDASVQVLLLELGDGRTQSSLYSGIRFCLQLKSEYPQIPILVLSAVGDPQIMTAAKTGGVDGWCIKGATVAEILTALESILAGKGYWQEFTNISNDDYFGVQYRQDKLGQYKLEQDKLSTQKSPFANIRNNLLRSGTNYINSNQIQVQNRLKIPGLPVVEKAVLAGRSRELAAAKWLLKHLLAADNTPPEQINDSLFPTFPEHNLPILSEPSLISSSPRGLQAELFANCADHIQQPLNNISDLALEIDILRTDKKRQLLYLVLQNFATQLDEIRASQLEPEKIHQLAPTSMRNLWESTVTGFFGKFAQITIGDTNLETQTIEISQTILNDIAIVDTAILQKIPRYEDLILYLIYQIDWQMENEVYPATHPEAKFDAQIILENLLIQVANAVIQPLINHFADIESVKQNFYARQMLSSREIERFRNNLSWKYRYKKYYLEPKAIFESHHDLFVFAPRGIAQTSVYAPRQTELSQLKGIPLAMTVGFELRDAIAPRLQSLVSILGSAVVFVLTQVVGRGLGLVAKGVLQGIGSAALPSNNKNR